MFFKAHSAGCELPCWLAAPEDDLALYPACFLSVVHVVGVHVSPPCRLQQTPEGSVWAMSEGSRGRSHMHGIQTTAPGRVKDVHTDDWQRPLLTRVTPLCFTDEKTGLERLRNFSTAQFKLKVGFKI